MIPSVAAVAAMLAFVACLAAVDEGDLMGGLIAGCLCLAALGTLVGVVP